MIRFKPAGSISNAGSVQSTEVAASQLNSVNNHLKILVKIKIVDAVGSPAFKQ